MKIICAGLPKTGTKSMVEALKVLGYDVYDVMENMWYYPDEWVKIMRDGAKVKDLQRMYKDVDAVCDIPCCFYWEELLEAFPDAKVILTKRDEDTWYKSFQNQTKILNADFGFKLVTALTYSGWRLRAVRNATLALVGNRGVWPWNSYNLFEEEAMKRLSRKHNRQVFQNAPKDQLLVYEVKQGWKPLCDFLEVDVPDLEFPHKNKAASLAADMRKENKIMRRMVTELYLSFAILFVVLSIATFKLITSLFF